MVNKEIIQVIDELMLLYKKGYNLVEPIAKDIIKSKNQNIHEIEETLDLLLNYPIEKSLNLYKELCEYYETVNPENAQFYKELYEEYFAEDEPKKRKKTVE